MVIKVIYKDGVFKPLTPVDLAEGVELEVEYTTHSVSGGHAGNRAGEVSSGWGLELGLVGTLPADFKELPEGFEEFTG